MMHTLSNEGMDRFNDLLREWRRAGRKIGWAELDEVYRLAREAEAGTGEKSGP